ncbi:MAG: MFS transporter [Caryophanon sp.]|nr:MFS transporter [Caryophanon sp.]
MTRERRATYHLYTFLVSKLFGSVGASIYTFGISMFILSMTGSAFNFAINLVIAFIPRIVLSPVIGTLIDKYYMHKKRFVLIGELVEIATIASLLLYTMMNGLSVMAVYIVTAIVTIASTVSSIAFSASIANLVDEERLQKAMAFQQISGSVAGILGPIIGGMLFGFTTMSVFLAIHVAFNVVTFLLESTMDFNLYSTLTEPSAPQSMKQSLLEGYTYLMQHHLLVRIFILAVAVNFFFACLSVGGDFILLELIGLTPQQIGITEAASAVGMLVMSVAFSAIAQLKQPAQLTKYAIVGLGVLIMVFSLPLFIDLSQTMSFLFYSSAMFIFGVCIILTNMPIGLLLQTTIEEEYRGRVFGLLETCAMSMMPISTLLFGILFDVVDARWILIGCGVASIICVFVTLPARVLRIQLREEHT